MASRLVEAFKRRAYDSGNETLNMYANGDPKQRKYFLGLDDELNQLAMAPIRRKAQDEYENDQRKAIETQEAQYAKATSPHLQSFISGGVNQGAGLARGLLGAVGADETANMFSELSEANRDLTPVSLTDDNVSLGEYVANPHGLARDLGGMAGSMAAILPLALAAEAAIPAGVGGALLGIAGRWGANRALQGLINNGFTNTAKFAATAIPETVGYGVTNAAVEAASEGGNTRLDMLASGASPEEAATAGLKTGIANIPALTISNMLEKGLLTGRLTPHLTNKAANLATTPIRALPTMAGGGLQQAAEEYTQDAISAYFKDEDFETNPLKNEGFMSSLIPGMIMGAGGAMVDAARRDTAQRRWENGNKNYSNERAVSAANVIAAYDKFAGQTMDNGTNGCVEAVTKIGGQYNDWLKGQLDRGVVGVEGLVANAKADGIPMIAFDPAQLEAGDVIVYDKPSDTADPYNHHVVIYDGAGGLVGNSSGRNKVVHDNTYEIGSGLVPAKIIKTGAGGTALINDTTMDNTAADDNNSDENAAGLGNDDMGLNNAFAAVNDYLDELISGKKPNFNNGPFSRQEFTDTVNEIAPEIADNLTQEQKLEWDKMFKTDSNGNLLFDATNANIRKLMRNYGQEIKQGFIDSFTRKYGSPTGGRNAVNAADITPPGDLLADDNTLPSIPSTSQNTPSTAPNIPQNIPAFDSLSRMEKVDYANQALSRARDNKDIEAYQDIQNAIASGNEQAINDIGRNEYEQQIAEGAIGNEQETPQNAPEQPQDTQEQEGYTNIPEPATNAPQAQQEPTAPVINTTSVNTPSVANNPAIPSDNIPTINQSMADNAPIANNADTPQPAPAESKDNKERQNWINSAEKAKQDIAGHKADYDNGTISEEKAITSINDVVELFDMAIKTYKDKKHKKELKNNVKSYANSVVSEIQNSSNAKAEKKEAERNSKIRQDLERVRSGIQQVKDELYDKGQIPASEMIEVANYEADTFYKAIRPYKDSQPFIDELKAYVDSVIADVNANEKAKQEGANNNETVQTTAQEGSSEADKGEDTKPEKGNEKADKEVKPAKEDKQESEAEKFKNSLKGIIKEDKLEEAVHALANKIKAEKGKVKKSKAEKAKDLVLQNYKGYLDNIYIADKPQHKPEHDMHFYAKDVEEAKRKVNASLKEAKKVVKAKAMELPLSADERKVFADSTIAGLQELASKRISELNESQQADNEVTSVNDKKYENGNYKNVEAVSDGFVIEGKRSSSRFWTHEDVINNVKKAYLEGEFTIADMKDWANRYLEARKKALGIDDRTQRGTKEFIDKVISDCEIRLEAYQEQVDEGREPSKPLAADNSGVANSSENIRNSIIKLAKEAWDNNSIHDRVSFAPSAKLRDKIKELYGHDVDEIFITSDDIRHIKKKHSEGEENRGQINISPEGMADIYDTVNDFDSITKEKSDKKGNQNILTIKSKNGLSFALLIERGKHKAEVKTFYKQKEALPMFDAKSPNLNAQDDSVSTSVSSNIPQAQQEVKENQQETEKDDKKTTARVPEGTYYIASKEIYKQYKNGEITADKAQTQIDNLIERCNPDNSLSPIPDLEKMKWQIWTEEVLKTNNYNIKPPLVTKNGSTFHISELERELELYIEQDRSKQRSGKGYYSNLKQDKAKILEKLEDLKKKAQITDADYYSFKAKLGIEQQKTKENQQEKKDNSIFGDQAQNDAEMLEALGINPDELEDNELTAPEGIINTAEERERLEKELEAELNKISVNPVFNPKIYSLALQLGMTYVKDGVNTVKKLVAKLKAKFGDKIGPWAPAVAETIDTWPKGVPFNSDKVMAISKAVGSRYENGITDLDAMQNDLRKLFKNRHKEFAPMIEASYNGISKFFADKEAIDNGQQEKSEGTSDGHKGRQSGGIQKNDEAGKASNAENAGGNAGQVGREAGKAGRDNTKSDEGNKRPNGEGTADKRSADDSKGNDTGGDKQPVLTPAQEETAKATEIPGGNYHFSDLEGASETTAKERVKNQMEAVRLLKKLEAEGRKATPAEQEVLAKFNGWGTVAEIFSDGKHEAERAELKELIGDSEYKAAARTVNNSYYTSPILVNSIWKMVERLGFKGGRILDPSMGTGNFFGAMPAEIEGNSTLRGVELNSIACGIAKQLYQKAGITENGYQNVSLADNYFDLAISNVPFEDVKLTTDDKYSRKYQLHNYFFAKTMDKVRPGGLVVFITAQNTLHGDADAGRLRHELGKVADLVGAAKLPNTAFKANAGTSVTADVLILQKRENPNVPAKYAIPWENVVQVKVYGSHKPLKINEAFVDSKGKVRKDNVLGTFQQGFRGVEVDGKDINLKKALNSFVSKLPENIYTEPKQRTQDTVKATAKYISEASQRDNAFILKDGKVFRNDKRLDVLEALPEKQQKKAKAYVELRQALNALIKAQIDPNADDSTIGSFRDDLNKVYDSFVKQYGYINSKTNLGALKKDPEYGKVAAIEKYSIDRKTKKETVSKADIFTKRTIGAIREVERVDDMAGALAASLANNNCIDLEYMKKLTGQSIDDVVKSLKGIAYNNPISRKYELAEEYLSGNVREKLEQAKEAAKDNPAYKENVEALEKVQPELATEKNIQIHIGMNFIPESDYNQFTKELVGDSLDVKYNSLTGSWDVGRSAWGANATSKWGTEEKPFDELLKAALNMKSVSVTYKTLDGKTAVNLKATEAANGKLEEIKKEFSEWIWRDESRKKRILNYYNNNYNNSVKRTYDGSHLTFPGMNAEIKLKPHQKNAVWRMLQEGNTLIAHCVGAGKTFEMQAAGMEMKRLGIANKPLYAVPNNIVQQFEKEFLQLYPNAKILTLDTKDLPAPKYGSTIDIDIANKEYTQEGEKAKEKREAKEAKEAAELKQSIKKDNNRDERIATRQKALSRIATEDWDAIIISHEMFSRIPMSPEYYRNFYEQQKAEVEAVLAEMRSDNQSDKRFVKQLQNTLNKLEEKLKADISEEKKDIVIPFEELGIDQIFVDEADKFKNLSFHTKMNRIRGISNGGSKRAMDMLVKTRYLTDTHNRGVVFATGTPISNTMNEMFTMMRYLDYKNLENMNLAHFDRWAAMFANVSDDSELSPDGTGYRVIQRMHFANLGALQQMWSRFADVKRPEDIPDLVRPKLKNGTRTIVQIGASNAFKEFKQFLVKRAKAIHEKKVDPTEDNFLKLTGDFRKASLDLRLVSPGTPASEANAKIEAICDVVANKYDATRDVNGAQVIFGDIGVPRAQKDNANETEDEGTDNTPDEGVTAYEEIKKGLIKRGIPAEKIAFVHDAKNKQEKQAMFEAVDNGEISVIIGSTEKMGAGTNFQHHLVALHHIDCPWRPRDVEQREGRILRQGNTNEEVEIFTYVTEGSFDSNMWEKVQNKAAMIESIMKGESELTDVDDVSDTSISYGEMVAAGLDDPILKEKVEVGNKLQKLELQYKSYSESRGLAAIKVETLPNEILMNQGDMSRAEKDIKERTSTKGDNFSMKLGDITYTSRGDAQKHLETIIQTFKKQEPTKIGEIAGFDIEMMYRPRYSIGDDGGTAVTGGVISARLRNNRAYEIETNSVIGFENTAAKSPEKAIEQLQGKIEQDRKDLETYKDLLKNGFPKQAELDAARARMAEIDAYLKALEEEKKAKEQGGTVEQKAEQEAKETQEQNQTPQEAKAEPVEEIATTESNAEQEQETKKEAEQEEEHSNTTEEQQEGNSNFTKGIHDNTKTGKQQPKAEINGRVERDVYLKLNASAKKCGGSYSRFAKAFLFSNEKDRDSFVEFADNYLNSLDEVKASSTSSEAALNKMLSEIEFVDNESLTPQQHKINEFANGLGTQVVWFKGDRRLNGYHKDNITYLNVDSPVSLTKTFWHETFHWLRNNNDKLYNDLLKHFSGEAAFTGEQLEAYRNSIGRLSMSDELTIEEMLADNMEDVMKRVDLLKKLANDNRSLAENFFSWIRRNLQKFVELFNNKEGKLTTEQKKRFVEAFNNLAIDLRDSKGKPIFKMAGGELVKADGSKIDLQNVKLSMNWQKREAIIAMIERQFKNVEQSLLSTGKFSRETIYDDLKASNSFFKTKVLAPFKSELHTLNPNGSAKEIVKRITGSSCTEEEAREKIETFRKDMEEVVNYASHIAEEFAVAVGRERKSDGLPLISGLEEDLRRRERIRYRDADTATKLDSNNSQKQHADKGAAFSVNLTNNNSSDGLMTKLKRMFGGSKVDTGEPTYNQRVKKLLEEITNLRIKFGGVPEGLDVILKDFEGIVRAKTANDWEHIFPVAGKRICDKLGIQSTEEMNNYIADWIMTGALNNTTQEAKDFERAMAKDENRQLCSMLTELQSIYIEQWEKEANERAGSIISYETKPKTKWFEDIKKSWNNLVEEFTPIKDMVDEVNKVRREEGKEEIPITINPYKLFRLYRGWKGKAMDFVEGRQATVKALQRIYPNVDFSNFKTLNMIFESVGATKDRNAVGSSIARFNGTLKQEAEVMKNFAQYCLAKHVKDIHIHNRIKPEEFMETPLSEADCDIVIRNGEAQFGKAQQDLVHYSNTLIDILTDAGVISAKHNQKMKNKWENYVPMFRIFDEDSELYDKFGNSTERLKGSRRDVVNPLESIIYNTYHMIQKAEKNKAKIQLANIAAISDMGYIIEKVDEAGPNTISYLENGKRKYLETDKSIIAVVNHMDRASTNWVIRNVFAPLSSVARACFTLINPAFAARNVLRDVADAFVYSKVGFNPIKDFWSGLTHAWNRDDLFYEWLASGAAQASAVSLDRNYTQSSINQLIKGMDDRNFISRLFHDSIDTLQKISEYSEYATRIGAYERNKKAGLKEGRTQAAAILEAAYESRDLMDFARGSEGSRSWNQIAIFSNAALQGWDKFFRTFDPKDPKTFGRALVRLALSSVLPALATLLWNWGDDDKYKKWLELPDWQKETHWIFVLGDNTVLRIPKGQDIGVRFISNAIDKTFESLARKSSLKPIDLLKPIWDAVPGIVPTALLPIGEAWANRKLFNGASIVPKHQEKLSAKYQVSPYSSGLSKYLGEKLDLSPRKIDHVIYGYTGNVGKLVLDVVSNGADNVPLKKQMFGWTKENAPVISGFFAVPYKNAKSVEAFYDKYQEQSTLHSDFNHTGKIPKGYNEALYKRMTKAMAKPTKTKGGGELYNLTQMERRIAESTTMTTEEKQLKTQAIQKKRIAVMKAILRGQ